MGRKKQEPTKLIRIKISDANRLQEYCRMKNISLGNAIRRIMNRR